MYVFGSGRCGTIRGEWITGLGLGCGNRGSVGRVSVFGLRWCWLCR